MLTGDAWMDHAGCAGRAKLMHPEPDDVSAVDRAKAICAGCPVQLTCLEWALARRERFGVWGGTSEEDREKLRRSLRREALVRLAGVEQLSLIPAHIDPKVVL